MGTFLATFTLFLVAVAAMSLGVMLSGKRLSSSCGGLGPDGEPLGVCACEEAHKAAVAAGEIPPELPACAPSQQG